MLCRSHNLSVRTNNLAYISQQNKRKSSSSKLKHEAKCKAPTPVLLTNLKKQSNYEQTKNKDNF